MVLSNMKNAKILNSTMLPLDNHTLNLLMEQRKQGQGMDTNKEV